MVETIQQERRRKELKREKSYKKSLPIKWLTFSFTSIKNYPHWTVAVTSRFGHIKAMTKATEFRFNRCQIDYSKTFHNNYSCKRRRSKKNIRFHGIFLCGKILFFLIFHPSHISHWCIFREGNNVRHGIKR